MTDRIAGFYPGIPVDMVTDVRPNVRRLQVDIAQTGFWAGREFRSFKEFSIAATALVFRLTVPSTLKGIIIQKIRIGCFQGGIYYRTYTGGTEGGSWSPSQVFPNNGIPDIEGYVRKTSIDEGGSISEATQLDSMVVYANENGKSNTTTVNIIDSERGIAPGTYYIELSRIPGVTVDSVGVITALYEERELEDPWVVTA